MEGRKAAGYTAGRGEWISVLVERRCFYLSVQTCCLRLLEGWEMFRGRRIDADLYLKIGCEGQRRIGRAPNLDRKYNGESKEGDFGGMGVASTGLLCLMQLRVTGQWY